MSFFGIGFWANEYSLALIFMNIHENLHIHDEKRVESNQCAKQTRQIMNIQRNNCSSLYYVMQIIWIFMRFGAFVWRIGSRPDRRTDGRTDLQSRPCNIIMLNRITIAIATLMLRADALASVAKMLNLSAAKKNKSLHLFHSVDSSLAWLLPKERSMKSLAVCYGY